MVVKCVQAGRNDLNNSLMYRSKAYWGYDDGFMDKFMQIFQMTPNYLEKNTIKSIISCITQLFHSIRI